MNKNVLLLVTTILFISACDKTEVIAPITSGYNSSLISYFKAVSLGFEFGTASEITRKWRTTMTVYIGGNPDSLLLEELELIKSEVNTLATDGFNMKITGDSLAANYYIFFGTADEFVELFPEHTSLAETNWGLFFIFWDAANQLNRGYMYVDTERASAVVQKHLLREELTQSLGMGKDSPEYAESIFQSAWTTTTAYAPIDKDVIRLLYHPEVDVGLNASEVENVLTSILLSE